MRKLFCFSRTYTKVGTMCAKEVGFMEREQASLEVHDESEEVVNGKSTRLMKAGIAVVTACAVGGFGGAKLGELAAENRPHAELSSGEVKADRAVIEAINFECGAESVWDVEAEYDYQVELGGKEVPGFGAKASFEEPTTVVLTYCTEDPEGYKEDTKIIKEGDMTLVKVPIDSFHLNAQIPSGNKSLDYNPYNGLKTGSGAAGVASGIAGLGCDVLSFGQDKLFGKENKKCGETAAKIDSLTRDFDTDTAIRAENQLVADVRKQGAYADWEDVKNIYRDATKDVAVKKADGDQSVANKVDAIFVDKNGNETDKLPEFKDMFDSLRERGILEEPDIESTKTKFEATKSSGAYKPKWFDPREEEVSADE